jgi:hypothetical protein
VPEFNLKSITQEKEGKLKTKSKAPARVNPEVKVDSKLSSKKPSDRIRAYQGYLVAQVRGTGLRGADEHSWELKNKFLNM